MVVVELTLPFDSVTLTVWLTGRPLWELYRLAVQDFINAQTNLAPKTIRNLHGCFRVVLNEGKRWGLLKENPSVGVRLPRLLRRQHNHDPS